MGLFLAMSGVIGAKKEVVESALRSFAEGRNGSLQRSERTTDDEDTLVLLDENAKCSVLYPGGFCEWDDASQHLSAQLNVPVFSLHIHDEDLWMFILFDQGKPVAQFNPIPEYWNDEISEEERASWVGDAASIASRVAGVTPEAISPYLRHWDLDEENPGKAFADDEFGFHDCWQMCDFMERLGLKYPVDGAGKICGETYEFIAEQK